MTKITIAIDGHSSTGKSTLAKSLAQALGYVYVDSGAMYRCVALFAMQNACFTPALQVNKLLTKLKSIQISFKHVDGHNRAFLNGVDVEDDIRTMAVSDKVSEVAAVSGVRRFLVAIQQSMGLNKGVVMDGRDIGTVVFPKAELKVFMTASETVRAQRRLDELKAKGQDVQFEDVLANISSRDHLDSTRKDSPLVKATDAVVLDNSKRTKEEQLALVIKWANEKIGV